VESRNTGAVLSGSKDHDTTFAERWDLVLTHHADLPWRIAARHRQRGGNVIDRIRDAARRVATWLSNPTLPPSPHG
jgi:hypothetical protein